ncbi:immunity protein 52 of polymorphic toxin system [Pseudoduganella lurida]|uniref:Immunity protein 52 of polymorphic toxin system n=1 Tax=Pseudoduganella lurida TaxID=1036180 RepID=A0A562R0E0_9BURK|nr:immunity 52 family protein [Pseudoduganella lurida]TWI62535.1 immunity protein 52 of polymorphic toxin system [Pseudoduganella lurida]
MSYYLTITATFRIGGALPSLEEQYQDLWEIANALEPLKFQLDSWYPPARTKSASLLNPAFTPLGPSSAALAMAKADKDNHDPNVRIMGVWNGKDRDGGASFTITYTKPAIPSNLEFQAEGHESLLDTANVISFVTAIVRKWSPETVQVGPIGYDDTSVFTDRPAVGWMLYLPIAISTQQVPEAAALMPITGNESSSSKGTLVISVDEPFMIKNQEHVTKANAIETRMVDQDLLPTFAQLNSQS